MKFFKYFVFLLVAALFLPKQGFSQSSYAFNDVTLVTLSASGQITSTLATGTAPFVVASTTLVTNLNAQFWNGQSSGDPGTLGYFRCVQHAAFGHAVANTITLECPTSVTAYEIILPAAAATGVSHWTNAANVVTQSVSAVVSADLNITATTCTNQFISVISSTATGTCTSFNLTGAQFANQGTTTTVLHGNAAGNPAFSAVVSADMNITTTTCTNQFLTAISATGTGTCTTATLAGAQFANQGTTTTLLHGNGAGNPSFGQIVSADMNITTTSCTNQFLTAISATGTGTCTTDTLASAQHANQGTTTTVLHGNGAGNPSFAAVDLSADVTGALATGTVPISQVTSAAGAIAIIANGDNVLPINCALTSSLNCLKVSETTAATTAGLPALIQATSLTKSTANAIEVTQGAAGPDGTFAPYVFYVSAAAAGAAGLTNNFGNAGAGVMWRTGAGGLGGPSGGQGGAGGAFNIALGAGAAPQTSTSGGAAGALQIATGAGGALIANSVGGIGGTGSVTSISAGAGGGGGSGTSSGTGGEGSKFTFSGGAGGVGGAASGSGGKGGSFTITTGAGGAATAGSTTGAGGDFSATIGSAGGTGTAGVPGQFKIVGGTVGGSNTTPLLNMTDTWNTSGVVDAAIFLNVTNSASGTGSKLMDLQIASATVDNVDKTGLESNSGLASIGTKFTASGCTNGTTVGGATAGKMTIGQNTACTVVITMGGAAAVTSATGWACTAYDQTAVPAVAIRQTASTTTTASLLMTTATNDVVTFACIGY